MKKKIIITFLMLFVLTGCGASDKNTPAEAPDTIEKESTPTEQQDSMTQNPDVSEADVSKTNISETDVNEAEENIDLDTVKWIDEDFSYIYSQEYADDLANGHYTSHSDPNDVAMTFVSGLLQEGKLEDIGDREIISEQDDERIYQFHQKDSGITTLVCINSYVINDFKIWYANKYSIIG